MNSTEYLAVGCFGKLPFEREYLEVNVSFPSSRAFRGWIRAGRQAAGMSPEATDGALSPETNRLRCLIAPPGSGEVLAAVIRPSADLQGRTFPFSAFVHVSRRPWARSVHLMPMGFERVWDALDDVWGSLASVASVPAFREIMASARIHGPLDPASVKGTYEAGQSAATARLFERGDGANLDALRANMPALLRELRSAPESVRLELPTSSEPGQAAFDASFWIDLINRQFFWRRFEPNVLLDGAPRHPARRGFLVFGDLGPGDYPILLGLQGAVSAFSRPAHRPSDAETTTGPASGPAPTYAELAATRFVA